MLTRTDYQDHFRRPVATSAPADRWARALFGARPSPGERILWQVLLGLRLHAGPDTIAGWPVVERSPESVLLLTNSRWMTVTLQVTADDHEIALTTRVQYDRPVARLLWGAVLSRGHRALVPGVLRAARV